MTYHDQDRHGLTAPPVSRKRSVSRRWRVGAASVLATALTLAGLTVGAVGASAATAAPTYTQIAAGFETLYALTADSQIYRWGSSTGQLDVGAMAGKTITQIAAGDGTAYALTSDGSIYAWGNDGHGQLGNGSTSSPSVDMSAMAGKTIVQIAAGRLTAYALASDGTVYAWGHNASGSVGDGSTTNRSTPVSVDMSAMAGKTINRIASGISSTAYAIATDGSIYAWGYNGAGQVGDGSFGPINNRLVPVAVDMSAMAGDAIIQMTGGLNTSYALASDGSIYAWGYNGLAQIGDGSTTSRHTPVAVDMSAMVGDTITEIAAGQDTAYALAADGSIYGWGRNNYGQVGDGSTTTRKTPVSVDLSAMAGKTATQLATAEGFAGNGTAYAYTTDGDIYAWSGNAQGQFGDGSSTSSLTPVRGGLLRLSEAAAALDVPETGVALDTDASLAPDASYIASAVTWASGSNPASGNAALDTAYTASITFTANAGFTFRGLTSGAVINGRAAQIMSNTGQTMTASYTFPATEKLDQDTLTITDPGMLTYGDADFTLTTVGGSGTGAVTYSVPANNGVLDVAANGSASVVDVGTVTVTAIKVTDGQYKQSSATRTVTVAPGAFVGALAPGVTGTAQVGQTLRASPTTAAESGLSPTPDLLAYQWFAGSTAIPGATGAQLIVPPDAVGQTISLRVTASRNGYTTTVGSSATTSTVTAGELTVETPKLKGNAKAGKRLTVNAGTWTGGAVKAKLTYQWFVGGKKIKGASNPSLKLKKSYAGKKIKVKVTGRLFGYATVTTPSAAKRVAK